MIISREFELLNKTGLHARPAANLVKALSNFNSDIKIIYNNKEVNAKSFISITSLGIEKGSKITVSINGSDAKEAMQVIENLVNNRFGEE
ncbi:MAG: HPr family phosphocarrier protein [Desulfurella sp.]|uniref:HPr family phosphocarrier protein n=1 Tax=Desulfurella sp. TaxID=1962857 RepID=UPI003CA856BA